MTREEAKIVIRKMLAYTDLSVRANLNADMVNACHMAIKALDQEPILDKIRAEILECLKALEDIEKSGFNIYRPNEMSGRRLTYQQCIEIIDKYKSEGNDKE